jgi:hypothetical protein
MLFDFSKILCYVDTSTHADNGLSHQIMEYFCCQYAGPAN